MSKIAHLWIGTTPTPAAGDRAVCGHVFGEHFTPAEPDDLPCVRCLELATPAELELVSDYS